MNIPRTVLVFAMVLGAAGSYAPPLAAQSANQITISVRSTDPTRVSGGDALVEVAAAGVPKVTVNGQDVSNAFRPGGAPGRYLGVLTGLKVGENTIAASQGRGSSTLKIRNYPITGPVFAGPKEKPFTCETAKFKLKDGSYLPAPKDADCSVDPVVTYVYKANGSDEMKPLPSRTQLPADVAQTTITTGERVPYVVRVESGVIDRGIYQLAVLHNPVSDSEPSPFAPPKGWNKRMIYTFGGGSCGMYRQGNATGEVIEDQFVGQGYAVMSNSLNVVSLNCDDLLSSESLMMTREHAIETLGEPSFTLGWGCSGGSHQVFQTADNYPGLMEGIVALCNSVDFYRLSQLTSDIRLLYEWFKRPEAQGLTDAQKQAITGTRLNASAGGADALDATLCPDVFPKETAFHPVRNPKGLRCGQGEHLANVLGRDPATGVALSTTDNVGVQYGLNALQTGVITVKQFLDLNEKVGGYDVNGQVSPTRSVADAKTVEKVYRTGRLLTAGGGLKDVPIVELRNYSDRDNNATHLKYGTNAFLARLERESGGKANYVLLLESHLNGPYSASRAGGDDLSRYALNRMDAWLTALIADKKPGSQREKIVRTKPVDLVDSCYDDKTGERIVEPFSNSGGRCNAMYPSYLPPRSVAGGPLSNDVLKCHLKPLNEPEYKVSLTRDELARLKRIFSEGVCDWSKPGVGQVPLAGVWQSFRPGKTQ